MLRKLYIKNYALIETLDVTFDTGLNIITGETGAGKSIIMDALSLILGSRAEAEALRDKNQKCIVEAEFETNLKEVEEFLTTNGFDFENTCIIRREIAPNGKSRSFINDTPATVVLIKELAAQLIDIHSQHQTLDIANALNQFEVVDSFADSHTQAKEHRKLFAEYKQATGELSQLVLHEQEEKKEHDYNTYLYTELSNAALVAGEEETIDHEIQKLGNADQIKGYVQHAFGAFDHSAGIVAQLKEVSAVLAKVKLTDENFASLRTRVESVFLESKDIASDLESIADEIVNDPQRLSVLETRFDTLNNLMAKHKVSSVSELLQKREELSGKLNFVDSLADKIKGMQQKIDALQLKLEQSAKTLYEKRAKQIPLLEKKINSILQELNMPHAKFSVALNRVKEINAFGNAEIEFLFTANKGAEQKPVHKVASGGEFSRLMLALKSVVVGKKNIQAMIFDEIDTGVSGEVAGKMGDIMRQIAEHIQVFSITHLPQVAGKGTQHYKVVKHVSGGKTVSELVKLDANGRIEEIAKMLSGEKITPEAMANAKVLLH